MVHLPVEFEVLAALDYDLEPVGVILGCHRLLIEKGQKNVSQLKVKFFVENLRYVTRGVRIEFSFGEY